MEQKYKNRVKLLWIGISAMFVITIFVMRLFHYGVISIFINCGFLACMTVMIRYGLQKGIGQLNTYTVDLEKLIEYIGSVDESIDSMDDMIIRMKEMGSILDTNEIKEQYQQFLNDYEKEDVIECNIADYMNYDQLTEKLSMRYCQILPNAMTALGILGTFLGLTIGLTQFDLSTTEAMGSSIQSFVSGINVAFFTSIYGIILSIFMNYLCNYIEERFEEKLVLLENRFDSFHLNRSAQTLLSRFYQEEQRQSQEIEKLGTEFGDNLAKSLSNYLITSFNQTNKNLTNMMGNMQKMQKDAIGLLAQDFLSEMNRTMSVNYGTLQKSVDELNKSLTLFYQSVSNLSNWQEKMTGEVKEFIGQVQVISEAMEKISNDSVKTMEQYNESFEQFSSSMDHIIIGYEENSKHMEQILETQHRRDEQFYSKQEKMLELMKQTAMQQQKVSVDWTTVSQAYQESNQRLKRQEEINREQWKAWEEQQEEMKVLHQAEQNRFKDVQELIKKAEVQEQDWKEEIEILKRATQLIEKEQKTDNRDKKFMDSIETINGHMNKIISGLEMVVRKQVQEKPSDEQLLKALENSEKALKQQIQCLGADIEELMDSKTFTAKIKRVFVGKGEAEK